jgi:hypothetical protein
VFGATSACTASGGEAELLLENGEQSVERLCGIAGELREPMVNMGEYPHNSKAAAAVGVTFQAATAAKTRSGEMHLNL